MRMRTIEISVGAFVLAGILALVFLAVRVSGINTTAQEGSYKLIARFNDIAGLTIRSKVSLAGVTIGRVVGIGVDSEYAEAIVTMQIRNSINNLPLDTGAKILTEGLLGGRYIGIFPGGDEEVLKDGDTITETQGAIVLENLIGDFITKQGSK